MSKIEKIGLIFAVLFIALAFVSVGIASAATIYVPDDYPTIQAAVDNATAGDTIVVKSGTYYLNNFKNIYNFYSENSANIWNSTSKITYTYKGNTYTNYLGNYWSEYKGKDANGNGIGDTPYSIDSDKDNYLLIEPWESTSDCSHVSRERGIKACGSKFSQRLERGISR